MSRRVPEANFDRPRFGVHPRVSLGLESHLGPVRHEWLYRIAPRIIERHNTTMTTWDTVIRVEIIPSIIAYDDYTDGIYKFTYLPGCRQTVRLIKIVNVKDMAPPLPAAVTHFAVDGSLATIINVT